MLEKYQTIGLLDHMGLGNMGDAAILEAFIGNIRMRAPSATLVAFSLNPRDTNRRHRNRHYLPHQMELSRPTHRSREPYSIERENGTAEFESSAQGLGETDSVTLQVYSCNSGSSMASGISDSRGRSSCAFLSACSIA